MTFDGKKKRLRMRQEDKEKKKKKRKIKRERERDGREEDTWDRDTEERINKNNDI